MTLFECFIIAHVIGDYLLQTQTEANIKMQGNILNLPLWRHVTKYTICCSVPILLFHLSPVWVVLIFTSHLILDRRWPIVWWRKNIMRNTEIVIAQTPWLTIVIDQIFHLVILFIIAAST